MASRLEKKRLRLQAARRRHQGEKIQRLRTVVDDLIWDQRVAVAGPPPWTMPAAKVLLGGLVLLYGAILVGAVAGC